MLSDEKAQIIATCVTFFLFAWYVGDIFVAIALSMMFWLLYNLALGTE